MSTTWPTDATRVVFLWLRNQDAYMQQLVRRQASEGKDALRVLVTEMVEEETGVVYGLTADLLQCALDAVDWEHLVHAFR